MRGKAGSRSLGKTSDLDCEKVVNENAIGNFNVSHMRDGIKRVVNGL